MEQQYMVVPNGIDTTFFHLQNTKTDRQRKVISVGQVYGRKNQHMLIQACKQLKVPLDIIGKSPPNHQGYYEYCQSLCDPRTRLIGYIPKEALLNSYATAWVHALPSWFETTGLSSLEAGAMGCNLVVGSGGDTREYFDGFAAFCRADNLQSIVEAVGEALEKPLSKALREVIMEKYTWERAAEITLKAYQKVLDHG
jgi:glycosyltransferase involved in cell wall biosynthesis